MSSYDDSPVPTNQRPIEEFSALRNSWFFSLAFKKDFELNNLLILSWLFSIPFALFIGSGSYYLTKDMYQLIFISSLVSLISPIILLLRQLLGWSYIYNRLLSDFVEYEESGWYDGEIWKKPISWMQKDKLVASHEVKPIVTKLVQLIRYNLITLLFGILIYFLSLNYI